VQTPCGRPTDDLAARVDRTEGAERKGDGRRRARARDTTDRDENKAERERWPWDLVSPKRFGRQLHGPFVATPRDAHLIVSILFSAPALVISRSVGCSRPQGQNAWARASTDGHARMRKRGKAYFWGSASAAWKSPRLVKAALLGLSITWQG